MINIRAKNPKKANAKLTMATREKEIARPVVWRKIAKAKNILFQVSRQTKSK